MSDPGPVFVGCVLADGLQCCADLRGGVEWLQGEMVYDDRSVHRLDPGRGCITYNAEMHLVFICKCSGGHHGGVGGVGAAAGEAVKAVGYGACLVKKRVGVFQVFMSDSDHS